MSKNSHIPLLLLTIIVVIFAFTSCEELSEMECKIYGHSIVIFTENLPTCVDNGLSRGESCERCGYILRDIEIIEPTGHKWVGADCTTPKHCEICGLDDGKALGHTEEIIPAVLGTCEQAGSTQGVKCSVCEEVLQEPLTSEIGEHVWGEPDENGNVTCTTCGESLSIAPEEPQ